MTTEIHLLHDSSEFVNLSDIIPDAVYDPRYYSSYNFIGRKIDGYDEECVIFSRVGAEALSLVSKNAIAQGYRLKIYDAYRPMRAVKSFIAWMSDPDEKMKEIFYPTTSKSQIVENGYISPRSAHARGCAIDLTLVTLDGVELDMGGIFDFFGEVSHYAYANLTNEQKENRKALRTLMENGGFRGIGSEWWHFELKDEPFPDTFFDFPVRKCL